MLDFFLHFLSKTIFVIEQLTIYGNFGQRKSIL